MFLLYTYHYHTGSKFGGPGKGNLRLNSLKLARFGFEDFGIKAYWKQLFQHQKSPYPPKDHEKYLEEPHQAITQTNYFKRSGINNVSLYNCPIEPDCNSLVGRNHASL